MVDEQEGCEWMDVSSGTDSPRYTQTEGRKTVVCVCVVTTRTALTQGPTDHILITYDLDLQIYTIYDRDS